MLNTKNTKRSRKTRNDWIIWKLKRPKVLKVQAKDRNDTDNEVIVRLQMTSETTAETIHRQVETVNHTQTNVHLTGTEVIPHPTMDEEMQRKYQSHVRREEIHRKRHRNASQKTEIHRTTVIIGWNIRRPLSHRIRRQNRKNISNRVATPRTVGNGIIHQTTMISTTRRRRKRVSVHDPDQGIEDRNEIVFVRDKYLPQLKNIFKIKVLKRENHRTKQFYPRGGADDRRNPENVLETQACWNFRHISSRTLCIAPAFYLEVSANDTLN